MSLTAITELSKRPSACAVAARSCERAAYASTSSRENSSIVAMRSAPTPCGMNDVS
jgi:hypothetical protein